MDIYSKNIKYLRSKKGYKQADLAEMLGTSRTTIANYEAALSKPDFSTLEKLLKIFNVTATELVETDLEQQERGGEASEHTQRTNKWEGTKMLAKSHDWSAAYNLFNTNKDLNVLYKKLVDLGSALAVSQVHYEEIVTETINSLIKKLGNVNPYKKDNSKFFKENRELIDRLSDYMKTHNNSLKELNKAIEIIQKKDKKSI